MKRSRPGQLLENAHKGDVETLTVRKLLFCHVEIFGKLYFLQHTMDRFFCQRDSRPSGVPTSRDFVRRVHVPMRRDPVFLGGSLMHPRLDCVWKKKRIVVPNKVPVAIASILYRLSQSVKHLHAVYRSALTRVRVRRPILTRRLKQRCAPIPRTFRRDLDDAIPIRGGGGGGGLLFS